MTTTSIALLVLAIAAGATLVLLLANGERRQKLSSAIPPAMRPMYADDELEGNHLERLMSWGLILTLFFAIFLPAYWLREPERANDKQEGLFTRDFTEGEELYLANCTECHGQDARGGAAVSPYGGSWPAPNLLNIATRYADSTTVSDVRDLIEESLYRGRPGTPMPAWGSAFGGPMTDFQVEAITDWILANQEGVVAEASAAVDLSGEELYLQNCARCHGAELQGVVGPSLVGVTERHTDESILGILQNGISIIGSGMLMPPWQNGYMYPDARYDDDALNRIVEYLNSAQPAEIPDEALEYQTPGGGDGPLGTEAPSEPVEPEEPADDDEDDATEV